MKCVWKYNPSITLLLAHKYAKSKTETAYNIKSGSTLGYNTNNSNSVNHKISKSTNLIAVSI